MIDGVSSTAGILGAASQSADRTGAMMDKDAFLRLFVTQMRHQDPMSPMNADDMAAQLAQFSSVEQLMGLREEMAAMTASNMQVTQLLSTTLAADMIGETVIAPGNLARINGDGKGSTQLEVGEPGGNAHVRVFDENGALVSEWDAGTVQSGRNTIDLSDHDLAEGTYQIEVSVTAEDGRAVEAMTLASFTIASVQFSPEGVLLVPEGGKPFPLGYVIEFTRPNAEA